MESRAYASNEFRIEYTNTSPPYNQLVLTLEKFGAKVQVTHSAVNVWCPFHKIPKVRHLINATIADDEKLEEPVKFMFTPSDMQVVIETPLGALAAYVMYFNENFPDLLHEMLWEAFKAVESTFLPKLKQGP